ncbi:hypothetical protein QBC40DRAFT_302094 [Triangularia verruculosa]|uniref:Uncharacterized protein n=1 Tax=Triangularia verruculosa TaxID=2587418 RepID=A0AAN7AMQ2_9PEZI|nr:hypothetical protein QBC40DRAFT_302094 [Triangularia verruculosa]
MKLSSEPPIEPHFRLSALPTALSTTLPVAPVTVDIEAVNTALQVVNIARRRLCGRRHQVGLVAYTSVLRLWCLSLNMEVRLLPGAEYWGVVVVFYPIGAALYGGSLRKSLFAGGGDGSRIFLVIVIRSIEKSTK